MKLTFAAQWAREADLKEKEEEEEEGGLKEANTTVKTSWSNAKHQQNTSVYCHAQSEI